ncbi:MAG: hypothetical protein RSA20_09990, partial [Oscillospiraceae bacterium]
MKKQSKIKLVNMLTVICAITALLSFSAMQGGTFMTVCAVASGACFSYLTVSLAKIESLLRSKEKRINSRAP